MACAILCSFLCVILTFVLGFAGFILFPLILLTVGQVSAPSSLQEPQELLPEHQMTIISPFPLCFAVSSTEWHLQMWGFIPLFAFPVALLPMGSSKTPFTTFSNCCKFFEEHQQIHLEGVRLPSSPQTCTASC